MVRLLAAAAGLATVVVVCTAAPSAGDDDEVTWEQVRAARAVAPTPPAVPPPASPATHTGSVALTIPDLSWALDDPTAPPAVRRAACHQATGTDDETSGPLAACLRHVG